MKTNIRFFGFLFLATPSFLFAQVDNFDSLNIYGASLDSANTQARSFFDLVERVSGSESNFNAGYRYNNEESDAITGRFAREIDSDAFDLIGQYASEGWFAGIAGNFYDADIEALEVGAPAQATPAKGAIDSDGYQYLFYAGSQINNWKIVFAAGGSSSDNDLSRVTDTRDVSLSSFDADSTLASLQLSYQINLNATMSLVPFVHFEYVDSEVDEAVEEGASDSRIVGSFSNETSAFTFGGKWKTGLEWYMPEISVGWMSDTGDDRVTASVNALDGTSLDPVIFQDPYENLFVSSVTFSGSIAENWNLDLTIDYLDGDDTQIFGLSAGIGFVF